MSDVSGPRRPDVPLYVLTSQGTYSAAEEFVFVLQNQDRASVVGTRTGGAGHMVNLLPVGHGFVLGVSITRVSDPESGRE
jgi:C-terminal processing protease CtpA/Prc